MSKCSTTSKPTQEYLDSFKYVYLDMDGTIADLYNIKDWLPRIRGEESGVFLQAKPMISEKELLSYFPITHTDRLWVLTMAPPGCSLDYKTQVFTEKDAWLAKYFPSLNNRVFLDYQYHKNIYESLKHKLSDILMVDDSDELRSTFDGVAIKPFWL